MTKCRWPYFFALALGVCSSQTTAVAAIDPIELKVASVDLLGGISEGGGKGVVCRKPKSNRITSAQVLDLYEAEFQWQLKIRRSTEPVEQQVSRAIAKLKKSGIYDYVELNAQDVTKSLRRLPAGAKLQDIDDALMAVIPACPVEQMANYFNRQNVLVNGDLWNAMTNTDRAALIVHEAVYRLDRVSGAKDSRRARRIVGELFSDRNIFTDPPIPKLSVGSGYCVTDGIRSHGNPYTSFFYEPTSFGYKLYFEVVNGERKLTPTIAEIPQSPSKTVEAEFQTVGSFESGDFIHLSSLSTSTDNEVQIPELYLDGESGWLPQTKFPTQRMHCMNQGDSHVMNTEITPKAVLVSPGPYFSCSDLYRMEKEKTPVTPSRNGPVVEFPHFQIALEATDQVRINKIQITLASPEISGGKYSFDLPQDEIQALLGKQILNGPMTISSDLKKSNGFQPCGLSIGDIPLLDTVHSFTADVRVDVEGKSVLSSPNTGNEYKSVAFGKAQFIEY